MSVASGRLTVLDCCLPVEILDCYRLEVVGLSNIMQKVQNSRFKVLSNFGENNITFFMIV